MQHTSSCKALNSVKTNQAANFHLRNKTHGPCFLLVLLMSMFFSIPFRAGQGERESEERDERLVPGAMSRTKTEARRLLCKHPTARCEEGPKVQDST